MPSCGKFQAVFVLREASISSSDFCLLSMPKLKTITEMMTKTDANIKKIEFIGAP